jgi:hypothetical protein
LIQALDQSPGSTFAASKTWAGALRKTFVARQLCHRYFFDADGQL